MGRSSDWLPFLFHKFYTTKGDASDCVVDIKSLEINRILCAYKRVFGPIYHDFIAISNWRKQ